MGTALVTGATSAIGEEFCWQLAATGHDLVLVARRKDALETLAKRLHQVAGVNAEVIQADLAVREDLNRVCARLDVSGKVAGEPAPVGLLVNNAGFGLGSSFLSHDVAEEEYALDVMVRAVMVLSHHAARSMTGRGRGAILNVASVAAVTGMGVYGAHKAWVRAFTEALSLDLAGSGVTATCVSPGLTPTNFHAATGMSTGDAPSWAWTTPEQVVAAALDATRRGAGHVTPGLPYKAAQIAVRLAPRRLVHKVTSLFPHM
ncbi:MAG: short-chain dehydrogenase [Actinobacteria bacterium]|nr:MAG: short-chain dehydrogenase [Actinomycetota bacterium]